MIFAEFEDDIHSDLEQVKRLDKAVKSKINLHRLDIDNCNALYIGSTDEIYETTLEYCTCMDFAMRKLPCKHMYNLAVQLKLIDINTNPWKTYLEDFKQYNKLMAKIKKEISMLSLEQLKSVYDFIDSL